MLSILQKAGAVLAIGFSAASGMAQADQIKVGGTGAAQGILQVLGDAFSASNPGDTVVIVSGLGSSGGISAVEEGALTLAVSGRPLKQDEKMKGLESIPFITTPFMFVTSSGPNLALTKADVIAIYDGSMTTWPNGTEIKPILRPKSDAASAFLIANLSGMEIAMEKLRQRVDVPVAATDQDNAQVAEKVASSFAGMTMIQFITERPRLHPIKLDGIQPSVENMQDGKYALKSILHLITSTPLSPAAQRFIAFTRSPQAQTLIRDNGGVRDPAHKIAVR